MPQAASLSLIGGYTFSSLPRTLWPAALRRPAKLPMPVPQMPIRWIAVIVARSSSGCFGLGLRGAEALPLVEIGVEDPRRFRRRHLERFEAEALAALVVPHQLVLVRFAVLLGRRVGLDEAEAALAAFVG